MPIPGRPVAQYDATTGEEVGRFPSIYAAAVNFYRPKANAVMVSIIGCCRGRQKTAYGYRWEYQKEEEK